MNKIIRIVSILLLSNVLIACSGMRISEGAYTTHAESIRLVGYSIPGDDQARARELVPADASIISVRSTPADWTSVLGIIGNILWIHQTEIGGTVAK